MLRGKVAIITGGASGIGAATARLFVQEGARAVLGDIQVEEAQKVASELGNDKAVAQECDVCREEDIERLVGAAVELFGRLDIFCANAGFAGKQNCPEAYMENLNTAEFDRQVQVNLRGVALSIKHAARAMKKNPPGPIASGLSRGCILATSSVAGQLVNAAPHGDPILCAPGYVASKAGVIHMCKLGACELAPYHIRINAVCPGFVATPMVGEAVMGDATMSEQDVAAKLAPGSPLRGVAILARDIAQAMLFLASDAARCVNGTALTVDCGLVAGVAGFVPGLEVDGEIA